MEGANTIAGLILEPVVGTNGILVPPDGYLQGVRRLCDQYGIVMIADEVMAGFGRTGKWISVDHEEDSLIERAAARGELMKQLVVNHETRHACVGAVRSIGLFGIVELVRDRQTMEPMAPFNGTSTEMQVLSRYFRREGLYTFVRWNAFFANPPLCITDAELREAFAIIDQGLDELDGAVRQ